jgi:hypothetical protein
VRLRIHQPSRERLADPCNGSTTTPVLFAERSRPPGRVPCARKVPTPDRWTPELRSNRWRYRPPKLDRTERWHRGIEGRLHVFTEADRRIARTAGAHRGIIEEHPPEDDGPFAAAPVPFARLPPWMPCVNEAPQVDPALEESDQQPLLCRL